MRNQLIIIFSLFVSLLTANTVYAQAITIEADSAKYDSKQQTTVFSGNVAINNNDLQIHGNQVSVFSPAKGKQRIIVKGTQQHKANFCQNDAKTAEKICGEAVQIEYSSQQRELRLNQQAIIRRFIKQQLKDQIEGEKIIYNDLDKTYSINEQLSSTDISSNSSAKPQRVKIIITPDSDQQP